MFLLVARPLQSRRFCRCQMLECDGIGLSVFRMAFATVLLTLAMLIPDFAAGGERRVALVIGNSDYEHVSNLSNPINDSEDLSAALTRIGFEVTTGQNMNYQQMRIALRDFAKQAVQADIVLIYFAGHGIEIDNTNYLIPVNAELQSDGDIEFEAIQLNTILNAISRVSGLKMVLVDACRNNPFVVKMTRTNATRSIGRGLGRVDPGGILVGYAARSGTLAQDGDGRNSPYAKALLKHIEQPGLELGKMFRQVRDTVIVLTDGYQEPFTYGSLPGSNIYLRAPELAEPSQSEVLAAFLNADAHNSLEAWAVFLEKFGGADTSSSLISRAQEKIAILRSPRPVQPPDEIAPPQTAVLRRADDDQMIRACDKLAADPEDLARPLGFAGVLAEDISAAAAVTACALASASFPNHARSYYQLARAHFASGNLAQEPDSMIRAVDLGYAAAGTDLGAQLISNAKSRDEYDRGLALLEAATEAGSAIAPRILGDHFAASGYLYKTEKKDPLLFYKIAAERGDTSAMYKAGYRLVSANHASEDNQALGVRYLEAAAEAGKPEAIRRLADFYLSKATATKFRNTERGLFLLEKSAETGSLDSARKLAKLPKIGVGGPPNYNKAAQWIGFAAIRGDPYAMVEHGYNFETGRGQIRSGKTAAKYYFEALENGNDSPYRRKTSEWHTGAAWELQNLLKRSPKARYRGPTDSKVGAGTRAAMARLCGCSRSVADVSFAQRFTPTQE